MTLTTIEKKINYKFKNRELLEQAHRLLEDMLDWGEDHPGAPQADLQAHVKQTWDELGRAMVKSVTKIRSGDPRIPTG